MYIFSDNYKLCALLTYKCFFALIFSLTVFSHTAFHCLCIFNFSPCFFFLLAKHPKHLSKNVYIFFVNAFQCIQSSVFSPLTCMKLLYLLIMQ